MPDDQLQKDINVYYDIDSVFSNDACDETSLIDMYKGGAYEIQYNGAVKFLYNKQKRCNAKHSGWIHPSQKGTQPRACTKNGCNGRVTKAWKCLQQSRSCATICKGTLLAPPFMKRDNSFYQYY
jgi:hypothetical protein